MKVKSLSHVRLFVTPWTAAYQVPPSVGFSRQEYWSGVPSPSLRKTIERINKTKIGFVRRLIIKLENFSQTDHENKKKKKRKIQITKVGNESGDRTTNLKEIKMNKREL